MKHGIFDCSNVGNQLLNNNYEIGRSSKTRKKKREQIKHCISRQKKSIVQHDYHDHAFDIDDEGQSINNYSHENMSSQHEKEKPHIKKRGPRGGVIEPFPVKLHRLLEDVDELNLSHIVSWQSHGRAFMVREPKAFVDIVMPMRFRQTKLTSFQRQLNLYGFSRITQGVDAGSYYHELFLRSKPFLTKSMVRIKIKGNGHKSANNAETEPNFYAMSPLSVPMKRYRNFDCIGDSDQNAKRLCSDKDNYFVGQIPLYATSSNELLEVEPIDERFHFQSQATALFIPSQHLALGRLPSAPEVLLQDGRSAIFEGKIFHFLERKGHSIASLHSLASLSHQSDLDRPRKDTKHRNELWERIYSPNTTNFSN